MKKEISKKIIQINFCLAAILAVIAVSMAAYTSLSSAKRVVSTTGANQLFSSNILYAYEKDSEPSTRGMSFSSDNANKTFQFTICNYAQGDKTTWATKDISYKLKITLLDSDGNQVTDAEVLGAYQLKVDNETYSFAELPIQKTLSYNSTQVTEHTYTLTVPVQYMNKYKIRIEAESDVQNYDPIGRTISITETSVSTHWTGTFTDSIVGTTNHTPSELNSINTSISGQENEIMIIQWNNNYVQIDPWFLSDIGEKNYTITTEESTGIKTMKFEVGGTDQPNQYHIIFYRTESAKTLNETWDTLKGYISFSYEAKESKSTATTQTGGTANEK